MQFAHNFNEETNFTAMERATGWSVVIVAKIMAHVRTPLRAGGMETFIPARPFMEEMRRRGLNVTERVAFLDG